jgi:MFS family permease
MTDTTVGASAAERLDEPVVSPGKVRITLATAFIAVALAQITNAMPGALNGAFQTEFQTTSSQLTWISTAFMIPLVCFELTFGLLGDRIGRRRLLFFGLALTIVGTVINATVPLDSVWLLWTGQAFDGLGAGILFPISLSLVTSVSPSPAVRARNIAAWAGFLSLGAVIAPLLGGLTASYLNTTDARGTVTTPGWHVAFWVAAVIAAIVFVLNFRAHESKSPEGRRVDIPGQITLALGLIGVLYATAEGTDASVGFQNWSVITGYIVGGLLLIAFIIIEARSKSPLIHLSVFKNRSFAIAGITAVIGMFAFLTYCFSMAVWTTGLQQAPAWQDGVLMIFVQGPAFLLIPLTGILLHRVSPRWLLTIGFALIAVGAFVFSTLPLTNPDHSVPSWTTYILPSLAVGLGFWLAIASITAAAVNTVPPEQQGMASATTNLLRDFGFSLGPVVGIGVAYAIAAAVFGKTVTGVVNGIQGLPANLAATLTHMPPLGIVEDPAIAASIKQAAGQDAVGTVLGAAGDSLANGFHAAFLMAGIAATVAALLALFGLFRTRASVQVETEL